MFASLRSLWRGASVTPKRTRLLLAKALIVPHFEYCCVVYSYDLRASDLTLLNRAFHATIRYIFGLGRRASVEPYVDRLWGCSLERFFKLRAMSFLHRLTITKTPRYLSELLVCGFSERTRQFEIQPWPKVLGTPIK